MSLHNQKSARLRRLTVGEQALAREVFGSGIAPRRIRIFSLPLWNRAFVVGPGLIVWPTATVQADFSDPAIPLRIQAVFVHELTHVWQAQNGISLLLAKIKAGDSEAAYRYDLLDSKAFAEMNIEQQAMVVEHAFMLSRGGTAPLPPEVYAMAQSAWRQV